MSDTPPPPPPSSAGGQPPTRAPQQPPTFPPAADRYPPPPPPPGVMAPLTAGPAAEPPTATGSPAPWKAFAVVAGSAVGAAVVAFLISWAVVGRDSSTSQPPASSNTPAVQGQAPGAGSSGSTSSGQGAGGTSSQRQSQSGAAPSARSGAS